MERAFELEENQLRFRHVNQQNTDGVDLSREEQQYLLPHFLMLLIGKPGSGKTTLLKQLITNPQMYYKKFDEVLLVSPSHTKMDLKIKKSNVSAKFSLDWVFNKIGEINEKQQDAIFGHSLGGKKLPQDKLTSTGKTKVASAQVIGDKNSRFQMSEVIKKAMGKEEPLGFVKSIAGGRSKKDSYENEEEEKQIAHAQEKVHKELKNMPFEEKKKKHVNILLVLDDVVSSIKKAEYDPRLAQLVMNRRHLIYNGTLSIIIVSQKYTLIPGRIRSNASWLIVYQLNPMDFEAVYRDVIVLDSQRWKGLLKYVFGETYDQSGGGEGGEREQGGGRGSFTDFMKEKKFENLGIWIEFNINFRNFKRIM